MSNKIGKKNLYAYDNDKKNILYAPNTEKIKDNDFYCPNCFDIMGIKKGNKNIHHFFHKTKRCSYESYLHKMGKLFLYNNLKNKLENNKSLELKNLEFNKVIFEEEIDDFSVDNIYYQENDYEDLDINNQRINLMFEYLNMVYFNDYSKTINKRKYINKIKLILKKIENINDAEIDILVKDLKSFLINKIDNIKNKSSIEYYKHNYSTNVLNHMPGDYQTETFKNDVLSDKIQEILTKWKNINKNSLEEILFFVNTNINHYFLLDHLQVIYNDNLDLKDFFSSLNLNLKNKIVEKLYVPIYKTITRTTKINHNINFNNYSSIYLDNKKYKGFLADVLVTNKDENNVLFFEISNTHKSTEKKIKSGIDIYEIDITNIEELMYLQNEEYTKLNIKYYKEYKDNIYNSNILENTLKKENENIHKVILNNKRDF